MALKTDPRCAGKADGNHAIRDVFKYIECSNNVPQMMCCPPNTYFVPRYGQCLTKKKGGTVGFIFWISITLFMFFCFKDSITKFGF